MFPGSKALHQRKNWCQPQGAGNTSSKCKLLVRFMNLEPAILCLVKATAELGERLANLELLADTEFERAKTAKFRGAKEIAKGHLLTRRNYEAEANRLRKLLHETEELIGKLQTVVAKHKLLEPPISSGLKILHDLQNGVSTVEPNLDAELVLVSFYSDAELETLEDEELKALRAELDRC